MSRQTLELLLAVTWAYRVGWNVGAKRMAAAMTGRSTGAASWPKRIAAWWRTRKAVADETPIRIMAIPSTPSPESSAAPTPTREGGTDGGPAGQYL